MERIPRNFMESIACFCLGILPSWEMPKAAVFGLLEGYDSGSLRRLAGETNPTMADCAPLFEKTVSELKLQWPTKFKALLILMKPTLEAMVTGKIDIIDGSRDLDGLATLLYAEKEFALVSIFIGVTDEADKFPLNEEGWDLLSKDYRKRLEKEREDFIEWYGKEVFSKCEALLKRMSVEYWLWAVTQ